jgi:hypothetical protein
MSIYINEQWFAHDLNDERGYGLGESGVYETQFDNVGDLFKALQKEYGKCISRVYRDDRQPIGWAFEKKDRYDDTYEEFRRETWVTCHTAEPTRTIEYHYRGLE